MGEIYNFEEYYFKKHGKHLNKSEKPDTSRHPSRRPVRPPNPQHSSPTPKYREMSWKKWVEEQSEKILKKIDPEWGTYEPVLDHPPKENPNPPKGIPSYNTKGYPSYNFPKGSPNDPLFFYKIKNDRTDDEPPRPSPSPSRRGPKGPKGPKKPGPLKAQAEPFDQDK